MAHISDFPAVFMSFDEPWADAFWEDLNTKFPRAHRVHGVKGLDACHKAAADAAGTDHFLTVDADTTVDAAFFDTTIPDILITPRFRLDWLSRNHVNGLVTGNGGLKFWSREMVMDMRTHEAAPQGTVSLDHEIGAVYPGESLQVTMPGVYAVTASAMTPYHAFRCGLRESVYLLNLMETTPPGLPYERHARLIEHWGSVGRHAQNGLWMIYGIRLGAQMRTAQAGFDATCVNDYDWITRFWTGVIMPRFGHGASRSPLTGVSWDEQRLNDEVDALGRQLATQGLVFADCDAEESARLAAIVAPLARSSGSIDALAEALLEGRGVRRDSATGHALIETAVMLGNPASCNKLARLHERKDIPNANIKDAERFFVNAMALGNPHAPWHLARLRGAAPDRTTPTEELDALIVLASARGFDGPPIAVLPKPRKIGPKPARFVDHVSIGVSMHGELRWRIPKRGPDHVVVLFENVSLDPVLSGQCPDLRLLETARDLAFPVRNGLTGSFHQPGIWLCRRDGLTATGQLPQSPLLVPIYMGEWRPQASPRATFMAGFATVSATADPETALQLAASGADQPLGLWWMLGAAHALFADMDADTAWAVEAALSNHPDRLSQRVAAMARAVRVRRGIPLHILSPGASRLAHHLMAPFPPLAVWQESIALAEERGLHETAALWSRAAAWIWPSGSKLIPWPSPQKPVLTP